MVFTEEVKRFAETVLEFKNAMRTEEAVKHSFIMPFLTLLGYNISNPNEVVPEYIADLGTKKGEKVDYAILYEGEPHIILEIKAPDEKLDDHFNQLYRYFNSLRKAKFAILTNGVFF